MVVAGGLFVFYVWVGWTLADLAKDEWGFLRMRRSQGKSKNQESAKWTAKN